MIHYENAPITEAILDLRLSLPPEVKLSDLAQIHEQERDRYPEHNRLLTAEAKFVIGGESAINQNEHGYVYTESEKLRTFQVELNGFTFRQQKPYPGWQAFHSEARRLWGLYKTIAKPTAVKRIALRYINRLELPIPFSDFKEYVLTAPEIAPGLPQGLSHFFMQLQIPQVDLDANVLLIVNETVLQPPKDNKVSFLLDLDVQWHDEQSIDEDIIWQRFETLHERKNLVFERSITDKMRSLIQ